jgi:hypothetical protein
MQNLASQQADLDTSFHCPRRLRAHLERTALALGIGVMLSIGTAQAQYKWFGADGQVNYGDRPPTADAKLMGAAGATISPPPSGENAELPFPVRAAAARFPVLLGQRMQRLCPSP